MHTCSSCRYSDPRISTDGDPILDCHRFPPVVHIEPNSGEPFMFLPQVDGADWCGEWSAPLTRP